MTCFAQISLPPTNKVAKSYVFSHVCLFTEGWRSNVTIIHDALGITIQQALSGPSPARQGTSL